MKGPWQAERERSGGHAQATHPQASSLPLARQGGARYLDTIAGSEEVVEEEGVAVDREQRQQPRGTQ